MNRKRELRELLEHVYAEHPFALMGQNTAASPDLLRAWHDRKHEEEER